MRVAALVSMGIVLVGACGGSDSGSSPGGSTSTTPSEAADADPVTTTTTTEPSTTTTAVTTTTAATPVAEAVLIEPAVELRTAAEAFAPVVDSEPVVVGDVLRTDHTGFAEVAYFDGSRTRLDVDTEFEVLELVDDPAASTVRTRMGVGRTWHRVENFAETDTFSVETFVATAVVQGTAFAITCPDERSCTFMVLDGTLVIELTDGSAVELVAPAALVVDDDSPGEPVPIPWDGAFSDEWLIDNADRDTTAGFASAATIFEAHGPAFASVTGTFTGTRTIMSITCTTYCSEDASEADVGFVGELTIELSIDCAGGSCELVSGSGTRYSFDGNSYRGTVPPIDEPGEGDCRYIPLDGSPAQVTGRTIEVIEVTLTPTAAEVRNGVYTVTSLDYDAVATVSAEGHCAHSEGELANFDEYMALPPYGGYTGTWSGSIDR